MSIFASVLRTAYRLSGAKKAFGPPEDDRAVRRRERQHVRLFLRRRAARRAGVAFWNVFGAMGGENSMIRFVENNWASKDYTHLSFRGGKEIASALLKAILLEKEFYDEADKVAH